MEAIRIILAIVGSLASFAGWFWLVVLVFRESRRMGYATMFLFPPLALTAALTNWEQARTPLLVMAAGFALIGGSMLFGSAAPA
ncbi:MAG TPA: hypothetical protein VI643_01625 [Planctomycetota bacterium]|nr:hypothetical protein [Planctomycetota bacterium]